MNFMNTCSNERESGCDWLLLKCDQAVYLFVNKYTIITWHFAEENNRRYGSALKCFNMHGSGSSCNKALLAYASAIICLYL